MSRRLREKRVTAKMKKKKKNGRKKADKKEKALRVVT
jgi:hypothetical protein